MRLPSLSLGGLELRRFFRAKPTRVAVAGLVLLPLLYAGLYLWSFWDPFGRLSHLPVALVVEDKPAHANGKTVSAGADLAKELEDRQVFGWKRVDAATAQAGVESGKYYMSLTIPRDFSANIASPSGQAPPASAALKVRLNDANSYVVGTIARSAFNEVSAAAGARSIKGYFDQIFVSFGTLHSRLTEAADGAGRLQNGANTAANGAGTLHDKLGEAQGGAGRLQDGSGRLADGLGALNDGAAQLADGSRQVSGGVQQLTTIVDTASNQLVPLLQRYPKLIQTSALAIANGADLIAREAGSGRLPADAAQAVTAAETAQTTLDTFLDTPAGRQLPADVRNELRTSAAANLALAKELQADTAAPERLRQLAADARTLSDLARKLAATPDLAHQVTAARQQIDTLNAGARKVADGASRLQSGTGQALSGADALTGGIGTLRAGLGQLGDGAGKLQDGIGQLATGSGRLRSGLQDGANQIPVYDQAQRDQRSGVMSEPVRLDAAEENAAPNYGTGFAPFFVPLSLWVGAMIIYMLLRPLNARALAGTAPAHRIALAGWIPATLIGVSQMLVVLGVLHGFDLFGLHIGLHLRAAHWPLLIGFLALATAAFVAVVQFVNAKLGPIGRVVALVLLMLQLTSAAGTYPIETSPDFFRTIQPFLPMPWVVTGMRHLVSGGDLASVWQGSLVLTLFLAGALLLTALTARRNRVWSMKRLHPALRL